ncbi:ABC-type glycerol-3-phosphate transport system, substrate-binding protein [Paenibacillus sp. OK060]|uniref:extracellular solute-binding protein n=1 Tax=Paenibacillus sp. OK060 TaxID=1881034 RepID=UPI00088CECC3|nr:extracellular solute-binding protein [Paenibacillus sp. OK060]SDL43686.1 ABC-type glycerol-3-phosphate transport system, substrate-binding protein [Paenibacillus sp. OK060]
MKRGHQVVLFAVLLLSLTILSPSFDFRGSQLNQERDQEKDAFPNTSSRSEDQHAPLEIVVSMSETDFKSFKKMANEVATSQHVEISLRNLEPDTYKRVLDNKFSVGESGDIVLLDSAEVQYHAKKGHLYPLNGTTLSKSLGETVVGLREMTEWNGYQWGMPFDFDAYVLAARSPFLDEAGLAGLPKNKEQWNKLVQQATQDETDLISINLNDPHAVSAWLNQFDPGMAPDKIKKAQTSSQTEAYKQIIQLIDQIQSHINVESMNPTISSSGEQTGVPMVVTLLSRLLSGDQGVAGEQESSEKIALSALEPLRSRSLVIAAGSLEAEEASRWIEGMTSSAVQSEWYQQANYLPAKQQELDLESQKLITKYNTTDVKSWFPADSSQAVMTESPILTSAFQKKIQQLLAGEITANQYVKSIIALQSSSK